MALSLGVRVGSLLTVGNTEVKVEEIGPGQRITLSLLGKSRLITDQERIEILPDVFVSMGMGSSPNGSPAHRLAFEAPRSIEIKRG